MAHNLDARQKRESCICVMLPFGRPGPVPDGSDADKRSEREHTVFNYAIIVSGVYNRERREAAFGICLPFTRPYPEPESANDADEPAERAHFAMNYWVAGYVSLIILARSTHRFVSARIFGRVN